MVLRWFKLPVLLPYHICVDIPHVLYFCLRSLYFKIFLASLLITFLSPATGKTINRHAALLYRGL